MRFQDWPQRLDDYIESRTATPFTYGAHDCCKFAAGAIEAITGEDRMQDYEYESQEGAAALITSGGSLENLVTAALGQPMDSPAFAGRGDVVLAELERGPTVGVCLGLECAFAADVGLAFRLRERILRAWRVD
jgi:hypothetical protein